MSQTPPANACARCLELEAQIIELKAHFEARISELEERLGLDSTNSSKPPSSDPPGTDRKQRSRNRDKRRRKKARRGGHQRQLLPPERVNKVVPCKPAVCDCCGEHLLGDDPQPLRHQTVELPPIEPHVTEFQVHTLDCQGCGARTRGKLPDEAKHTFGPRLVGLIGLMIGTYHLSRRQTQGFLSAVMNMPISTGSVQNQTIEVAKAVAEPVAEVAEVIKSEPVVHCDESGWKRQRGYRVLWVAVTKLLAHFKIQTSRSKAACQDMVGAVVDGRVISSDRYGAYRWIPDENHQVCWAHLDRDFLRMSKAAEPLARQTGLDLLKCADEVFEAVADEREGKMEWAVFVEAMARVRERVRSIAVRGLPSEHKKTRAVCRFIVSHEEAVWTFARVRGVEVTNNRAERAIRPAVLWRRSSLGTRTDEGERFVGGMLTVSETLKLQGRDILSWLTEAICAHRNGSAPPSLLPQPT